MRCPGCSAPLAVADGVDGAMFLCARCGGAWLDNAASTQVATASLSRLALQHAHEAGRLAVGSGAGGGYRDSAARDAGDRLCPVCQQRLRDAYVPQSMTHLDICDLHGTFFDRDELVAVHTGFENEKLSAEERRRALAAIITKYRPGWS